MIGRMLLLAVLALLAGAAQAAPAKKQGPVRHATAARDWTLAVAATPEGGVRMGNPAAPVKLIEYGSRTCPHCAHFAADGVPALKSGYIAKGRVSYEFRDYPIHDAADLGPILLGRCVGVAHFFPLLDAMMAAQPSLIGRDAQVPAAEADRLAKAKPAAVVAYLAKFYGYTAFVARHGVPPARAAACLADPKALAALVDRAAAADRDWHVASTPTFIVNGTVASDASTWATLEPVLQAALAK